MIISIIVPVYNVEDYISECIDSILTQTFSDWELILVDDGSTDSSGKICDEYALKDSRIKVIHKNNGGLSSARNAGLDIAKGEYITFIDSDDVIIGEDVFENIINCFVEDPEIDIVQYDVIHKWQSSEEHKRLYPFKTYYDKEDILKAYLTENIHVACWDKIFKAEIFKEIRFPLGQISEDIAIIPQIVENTNNLKATNIGYYGYRYRDGSITNSNLPYNKICSILESYYSYLKYAYTYKKLRSLCIEVYILIMWGACSRTRRNYPNKINEFCTNKFFIRLNLKEWLKICNKFTFDIIIKSFIACVLGPKWIFRIQKLFTRDF